MALIATVAGVGVAVAGVAKGVSSLWNLYQSVRPNKKIKNNDKIAKYAGQFATFKEDIVFKQCEGCDPTKWGKYIAKLCKRHRIPNSYATDFLDDIDVADKASTTRNEFEFKQGIGVFIIGGFAANKRMDGKIDFVMWYFSCSYSTKTKSVSTKEKRALNKYFHHRAAILFEQKMPIPSMDAAYSQKMKKIKIGKNVKSKHKIIKQPKNSNAEATIARFLGHFYIYKQQSKAWKLVGKKLSVRWKLPNCVILRISDNKMDKTFEICMKNAWLEIYDQNELVVHINGIDNSSNKKIINLTADFQTKDDVSKLVFVIRQITQNECSGFYCKAQRNAKVYCPACLHKMGHL